MQKSLEIHDFGLLRGKSGWSHTSRGLSSPPQHSNDWVTAPPVLPGEAGMAHCGVEGEAGATARQVGVPPVIGESGGITCVDNGLVGVRDMVGKQDEQIRNGFFWVLKNLSAS
jgi:hypothetical protein